MARLVFCFLTNTILLFYGQGLLAQGLCDEWLGKLSSSQGRVESRLAANAHWKLAVPQETYCPKDQVRTWEHSRAVVRLSSETNVTLDQNTALHFTGTESEETSWLNMIKGMIYFRSRVRRRLEIKTPFLNAVIRGTEFLVVVEDNQTEIIVYEGVVDANNKHGSVMVNKGQGAVAQKGRAPVLKIRVKPKDAVQWTLYYPPLIDDKIPRSTPAAADLQRAVEAYKRNDITKAFAILDGITPEARREDFYTIRAGLLLVVGRADEAQPDLISALSAKPDHSPAIALQSIIAVTQNNNDSALDLAQRAVKANPKSAQAQIALSYANQAKFNLEASLENLQRAVELSPDNALAWARLSELQLSFGDLDAALESARKTTALDPDLARTQSVLGFAELTQINIDEAKAKFKKAIELDSADPLPHLGLGLAKIRQGDIEEGTEEIQLAASLDPDNSLIRSYLGKAFYELKDDKWSEKELAIAKELDPKDPTPWFYDAIRKQTTNRPVEALHDMQKAIELNDNRAVYRSRLLLDDDIAARSASLGRIYNDLGFQQLGLLEGWKSANSDPSNYSARRLLADNYAALPRHEIARVSELLQSQLLQPSNITPVQPQLAEDNLLVLSGTGPGRSSFNEFNPLFNRKRFNLIASGTFGSNSLFGEELVHSAILDKFSYSLGQFHYENKGYRTNNAIDQNIYNAFGQFRASEKLSLQAEYRYRENDYKDLRAQFDPDDFRRNLQQRFRRHSARFGANYKPNKSSTILFSGYYNNDDFDLSDMNEEFSRTVTRNTEAFVGEVQYIKNMSWAKLVIGGNYSQKRDPNLRNLSLLLAPPFFPFKNQEHHFDFDAKFFNGYLYSYWPFGDLEGIVGISYNSLQSHDQTDRHRITPKLGAIWTISESTTLRFSYVESLHRLSTATQTIEPTQVAGFVQFFDDREGTESKRIGLGLDNKFTKNLFGGLALSYRTLDVPTLTSSLTTNGTNIVRHGEEEQNEILGRSYLYWTPTSNFAFSIEYFLEKRDRNTNKDSLVTTIPGELTIHRIPLKVSYFSQKGFYARASATYVEEHVKFDSPPNSAQNEGNEHFFTLDLTSGYRLPSRIGIIEAGVRNILDEKYKFADLNLGVPGQQDLISRRTLPRFIPERNVFLRFILNFDL